MPKHDWKLVLGHTSELGEGPVWDDQHQRLLWVDILRGEIHQYFPENQQHTITEIGQIIVCCLL
jgi:sugar lactone lactonase YvrE